MPPTESPAESRAETVEPTPRAPRKVRFKKGTSGNPGGKFKTPPPATDPSGEVTAASMAKVAGQGVKSDKGPVERALRKWFEKDPKGYLLGMEERAGAGKAVAELRAENARLAAENAELRVAGAVGADEDPGTEAALDLTTKLQDMLAEAGADVGPDGRCVTCGQRVEGQKPGGG